MHALYSALPRSMSAWSALENQATLRLVAFYQDYDSGLRARQVSDELSKQLKPDCTVHESTWNFDLLAIPRLGTRAKKEVADADLVLVSMHPGSTVPRVLCDWLSSWAAQDRPGKRTLMALFDVPDTNRNLPSSALASLRTLALESGIEFFANPTLVTGTDGLPLSRRGIQPAPSDEPNWIDSEAYAPPSRHWGLNE